MGQLQVSPTAGSARDRETAFDVQNPLAAADAAYSRSRRLPSNAGSSSKVAPMMETRAAWASSSASAADASPQGVVASVGNETGREIDLDDLDEFSEQSMPE